MSTKKKLVNAQWIKDSDAQHCEGCKKHFNPITRRRHHCRRCGHVFCEDQQLPGYASGKDFTHPERCCAPCADFLMPLQEDIERLFVTANQDVLLDRENQTTERYLTMPSYYTGSFASSSSAAASNAATAMHAEIKKASFTLINFTSDNAIEGKDRIPSYLLKKAKGIVFLTILKVGVFVSGRFGTGVVIARLPSSKTDPSANTRKWSAPSAVYLSGVGCGMQLGGEVSNVVLILRHQSAVDMFCTKTQVQLGTELGVSIGPLGRSAESDVQFGKTGAAAVYSYAHSKGLFAGLSLEASVISNRTDVNEAFYGKKDVTPRQLLKGLIAPPKAAECLYSALKEVMSSKTDDDSDSDTDDDFASDDHEEVSPRKTRAASELTSTALSHTVDSAVVVSYLTYQEAPPTSRWCNDLDQAIRHKRKAKGLSATKTHRHRRIVTITHRNKQSMFIEDLEGTTAAGDSHTHNSFGDKSALTLDNRDAQTEVKEKEEKMRKTISYLKKSPELLLLLGEDDGRESTMLFSDGESDGSDGDSDVGDHEADVDEQRPESTSEMGGMDVVAAPGGAARDPNPPHDRPSKIVPTAAGPNANGDASDASTLMYYDTNGGYKSNSLIKCDLTYPLVLVELEDMKGSDKDVSDEDDTSLRAIPLTMYSTKHRNTSIGRHSSLPSHYSSTSSVDDEGTKPLPTSSVITGIVITPMQYKENRRLTMPPRRSNKAKAAAACTDPSAIGEGIPLFRTGNVVMV